MEEIGLIYPNGDIINTSIEVSQRIICRQIRMKIPEKDCIKLPETHTFEIQKGVESCCGGDGKIVIKKVSISKSRTVKK